MTAAALFTKAAALRRQAKRLGPEAAALYMDLAQVHEDHATKLERAAR